MILSHDTHKLQPELGQVWTPPSLASHMVTALRDVLGSSTEVDVLDPAAGPMTFADAAERSAWIGARFDCFEIDESLRGINDTKVKKFSNVQVICSYSDFLKSDDRKIYDAAILNPPYIRQELIDPITKDRFSNLVKEEFGQSFDRRSNLFVYFLLESIRRVKNNGFICAIVYDAINESRYGRRALEIIDSLCETVSSERIETPFRNTLIDGRIVVLKKRKFSITRALSLGEIQAGCHVRLNELVDIRRGASLSPRRELTSKTLQESYDIPVVLKSDGSDAIIRKSTAWAHSEVVIPDSLMSSSVIFNYYIRSMPKFHLKEHGVLVGDNYYVLSPRGNMTTLALVGILNTQEYISCIEKSMRRQGSGLMKIQVYELKQTMVPDWSGLEMQQIMTLEEISLKAITEFLNPRELGDKVSEYLTEVGAFNVNRY